jgi:tetratricopeptide (TPR) repeat protein
MRLFIQTHPSINLSVMNLKRSFCCVFLIVFLSFSFQIVHAVQFTKEQLFQLATLALKDQKYEQGIDLFQKVIDIDPKFAPAYNGIGLVYLYRPEPDVDTAIRYFKLSVDMSSDYIESWNNLGRAYYLLGRFSLAKEAFLKSLKLDPEQPQLQITLGWVYLLGESRPTEAIESFDIALKTLVDNDTARYGRGLAYLIANDRYKVMDTITELRKRQKNEEALKLENMLKGNIKLISEEGKPLVTGDGSEKSVFDEQLHTMEGQGFKGATEDGGIKVRLRGPLNAF